MVGVVRQVIRVHRVEDVAADILGSNLHRTVAITIQLRKPAVMRVCIRTKNKLAMPVMIMIRQLMMQLASY